MSKKVYTLELTAEELEGFSFCWTYTGDAPKERIAATSTKLEQLRKQAKADREADEMRLPWKAVGGANGVWDCIADDFPSRIKSPYVRTERAAKLMSAAPELLEAVRACKAHWDCSAADDERLGYVAQAAIDRALRKVETGVPE